MKVIRTIRTIAAITLAAFLMTPVASAEPDEQAKAELKAAFDNLIIQLNVAREAIDNPQLVPPESTNRNLSDGYAYMLGHVARIFETELHQDPMYPQFQRATNGMFGKYTIDNADTAYQIALINPDDYYVIKGRLKEKGPRFLSIAATTAIVGDTGALNELFDCTLATVGVLTSFDLTLDKKGKFEVLVGPAPDPSWDGDFIPTRGFVQCDPAGGPIPQVATNISARQIFSDWNKEDPLHLEITNLNAEGKRGVARNSVDTAAQMVRLGQLVTNQMRFWNFLNAFALEPNLPLNGISDPGPPFIAGGTAGSGQLFASGIYELGETDALILEAEIPVAPHYCGATLGNLWSESLNQANHTSSRSCDQVEVSGNGKVYYVVSHSDPGVPNWLDTTGLEKGNMVFRYVFENLPDEENLPSINSYLVDIANVAQEIEALGGDAPYVSPEKRAKEIAIRQEHIKKRYAP